MCSIGNWLSSTLYFSWKKSYHEVINSVANNNEKGKFRISSKKVCTEILKLGDAAKRATKEEIKKVKFACTTDYWTSLNNETCATLAAHYIDSNW